MASVPHNLPEGAKSRRSASNGFLSRLLEGMALIFAASVGARGVSFVATVILARLLAPSDFGLISLGLIGFNLVTIFAHTAVPQGFLQSQADFDRGADTTFVLLFGTGVILCGGFLATSSLIGQIFHQDVLGPVIALLAVAQFFGVAGRLPIAVLERHLEYRKRAIPEIVAPIAQAITSLTLAISSHGRLGVWALAWGYVAYWFCWASAGWLLSGWRPHFQFDRTISWEVINFTRDIIGVDILVLLIRNLDNLAVGKALGPEQLGLYALAFNISQLPTSILATSMSQVLFPAFAQLQSQPAALREVHHHAVKLIVVAAFPVVALVIIAAPEFIQIVYGEKWLRSIVPLQYLALDGLVVALVTVTATLFSATGQRRRCYPMMLSGLGVILVFIYPALQWGINAVAALFTIGALVGLVVGEIVAARAFGHTLREQVEPFVAPAFAAVATAAVVSLVFHRFVFHNPTGVLGLLLLILMGATLAIGYGALLLGIDSSILQTVREFRSLRSRRGSGSELQADGVGVSG